MVVVYCPKCGNKLFNYSENATNNLSVECRKCRILVTRHYDGSITTGKVPLRTTSSGMRFW